MTSLNQYRTQEHNFAQFVRILGKGKKGSRSLTESEARDAMQAILEDETLDLQLGAFLMLLRVKEESAEELAGFVQATKTHLQQHALKGIDTKGSIDFDWPTYAGKRRHLPWFLLSIKLLAKNNFSVVLHGTAGHTLNRVYTESACKILGIPVLEQLSDLDASLAAHTAIYCPLRLVCPRLDEIIHFRNILGLRSPVHTLTRLLNPFQAKVSLQSIFHPGYKPIHQAANQRLNQVYPSGYQQVAVLKGEGGEFERIPESDTLIQAVYKGQIVDEEWPKTLPKRQVKPDELILSHLLAVWKGTAEDTYGEAAVIATLAIALRAYHLEMSPKKAEDTAKMMWHDRKTI